MAPRKAGSAGDLVKFTVPKGAKEAASRQANTMISGEDVHAVAYLTGLVALAKCEACASRIPCAEHNKDALTHALCIGDAARTEDGRTEHQALVDLYHDLFAKHRGYKPTLDARTFGTFQKFRHACTYKVAREAIEGAFQDRHWRSKVTIYDIASNPDRFRGTAKRSSGAMQLEEDK